MGGMSEVVVVTWFTENQVGFLDFGYRVEALVKRKKARILSNRRDVAELLKVPDDLFTFIPCRPGLFGFFRFGLSVRRWCEELGARRIVLLHSKLAPLTLLLKRRRTFLYWNEHPTHLYPGQWAGALGQVKNFKDFLMRWLSFRGARLATMVMPIGEHQEVDLHEHGCPNKKVKRIYMGVRDDFASGKPENSAGLSVGENLPLRVIYTGAVHVDRGRDLMIEAVSRTNKKQTKARLTIVGADDKQKADCKQLARRLGVEHCLTVVGRVSGDTLKAYLRKADVGLCLWADKPYWRFNPPTKLFEYLVAGLPVLANEMRTHTQYIEHGKNGCICDYDAASLAEQMTHLADNMDKLAAMRNEAIWIGKQYKWSVLEPLFMETVMEQPRSTKIFQNG